MPFQDCICFRLGKTVRKVTRAYREEIANYELTHGQFFLIVAIIEEEGLLPSELAEKTFQDRPTITGLLDRLEKDAWIERKPDPGDRRSLRIYLGARGNSLSLSGWNNNPGSFKARGGLWLKYQEMINGNDVSYQFS
jgi:DNA-binding MarR family transcriptional regulator